MGGGAAVACDEVAFFRLRFYCVWYKNDYSNDVV